jgi:hypothetical protein
MSKQPEQERDTIELPVSEELYLQWQQQAREQKDWPELTEFLESAIERKLRRAEKREKWTELEVKVPQHYVDDSLALGDDPAQRIAYLLRRDVRRMLRRDVRRMKKRDGSA